MIVLALLPALMQAESHPIKALPNGIAPSYGVSGVTPEQEAMVRGYISDMAPDAYPTGGIAFVPADKYKKLARQIQNGTFMGRQVGHGEGAQETFGPQGSTHLGNGFSVRGMGRTWLNADLLNRPEQLKQVLAHEMGHFASSNASEDSADEYKDKVYAPRMKAQEQLSNTVMAMPPRPILETL